MAYAEIGLQPIGGQSKAGNAPQMWSYKSADAIATVNSEGYFNDASDVLKVGDLIYVYDSNTPTANLVVVLSNASGVVDVSDLLKVGDIIYVHASTGGTRTYSLHPVVSNASGVVVDLASCSFTRAKDQEYNDKVFPLIVS